jgi:hypothetical protein
MQSRENVWKLLTNHLQVVGLQGLKQASLLRNHCRCPPQLRQNADFPEDGASLEHINKYLWSVDAVIFLTALLLCWRSILLLEHLLELIKVKLLFSHFMT